MDTIAVARAGAENVVASCGTSLTEAQVKLVSRFTKRIVVNYDPDNAGQAATERSLALLLEQDFDTRVLALPSIDGKPADPDTYIQKKGAAEYRKLLENAPPFLDYLISRARQMDLTTAQGKLNAVNFLMPHVQRIANPLLRSEWATRISQQLRVEEPVLRESLRKAAAERRGEVKAKPELIARSARPAERRLVQMLIEADDFRQRLAQEIIKENLHAGLETERVFTALLPICAEGGRPDAATLAATLDEMDRNYFSTLRLSRARRRIGMKRKSCLGVQRRKRAEAELMAVEKEFEVYSARPNGQAAATAVANRLNDLLVRKQELRKRLGDA